MKLPRQNSVQRKSEKLNKKREKQMNDRIDKLNPASVNVI